MTTFVLVHGAWHGPWAWDRLIPLLQRAGARTITPALSHESDAGLLSHIHQTVAALDTLAHGDDGTDDVVLVGHSYAGLVVRQAAAARFTCTTRADRLLTAGPPHERLVTARAGSWRASEERHCFTPWGWITECEFWCCWVDSGLCNAVHTERPHPKHDQRPRQDPPSPQDGLPEGPLTKRGPFLCYLTIDGLDRTDLRKLIVLRGRIHAAAEGRTTTYHAADSTITIGIRGHDAADRINQLRHACSHRPSSAYRTLAPTLTVAAAVSISMAGWQFAS